MKAEAVSAWNANVANLSWPSGRGLEREGERESEGGREEGGEVEKVSERGRRTERGKQAARAEDKE